MAYENKYLDATGVKHLWDKAGEIYVKQEEGKVLSDENYTTIEKTKLAGLENYTLPMASSATLGGIKLGEGLLMDANGVVRTVYNPEMGVDWDIIENVPTTLSGYGITDAATKTELEEVRISANKAIHYIGQVNTTADLENIVNPKDGDMYDVKEDGMNYAWSSKEQRWDNLGVKIQIDALSNYDLDIITGSASTANALIEILSKGGSAELGADITLSEPVSITKNTVLDLNNFTLTSSVQGNLFAVSGARLTLKNGSVSAQNNIAQSTNGGEVLVKNGQYTSGNIAFSALGRGSKVTLNGGTVSAVNGGINASNNAEIAISNGSISCSNGFSVSTNSTEGCGGNTVIIAGGNLTSGTTTNGHEACCVYIGNNDTVSISGGSITTNGGCGLLMRGGNVTITSSEITTTVGPNSPGYVEDEETQMSASAVIFDEASGYPGNTGMSLNISGGVFVGAYRAVEILSNAVTPHVTISGGSFTPAL